MASVQTEADGDIGEIGSEFAQGLQFFEARAEMAAGACGILEQDGEMARSESVGGVAECEDAGGDGFLDGLVAIAAGMEDEVFGADGGLWLTLLSPAAPSQNRPGSGY